MKRLTRLQRKIVILSYIDMNIPTFEYIKNFDKDFDLINFCK